MFKAKKAFTLLEVVISITIFIILLIFLYRALDDTKLGNRKFEKYLQEYDNSNYLYKIFSKDIAQSISDVKITQDLNGNSIIIFESTNNYYNPFYKNIAYIISSNNNLMRIESEDKFEKANGSTEFYNKCYITKLLENVDKFLILKKEDKIVFIVNQKNKDRIYYPTYKIK
ncbi:hypothetical protein CRV05_02630 [Halarcobacter bivalviorum]|uniref:Prepilin-type N-terminal cleavage/methylation domain-containing protein n=1 Tax=Halarcobacter bivalviorum TaxID=663364 RepID=A0AAX2ACS1_9BACT|nr:hypothetical protein ABIV_1173 [Halarcobacter bivalviorum]RXK11281.1 hypothetical protein CRV05_02630 [Halarcobacter bivalviorum]